MQNPLQIIISEIDRLLLWQPVGELKRNQFLKVKGSTDTNLYHILEGSVRIFITDRDEEQIIRFGYTGDLITALDSYITEGPSDFFIQAIKKVRYRAVSKNAFVHLMTKDSDRLKIWHGMMEQMILQQMERERDLLTDKPEHRYQRVLARSPHLFQEIPHKYIANYLRMTPETLSRLKKS